MTHGPGMHGPLIMVLFLMVLVGGLAYGLVHLIKSRRGRTRVERAPESDRGPQPPPGYPEGDRGPEHPERSDAAASPESDRGGEYSERSPELSGARASRKRPGPQV